MTRDPRDTPQSGEHRADSIGMSADSTSVRQAINRAFVGIKMNKQLRSALERHLLRELLAAAPRAAGGQREASLREHVQAIVNRWDDDKNEYRGRVMIMQLKAALAAAEPQVEEGGKT